jgi:hypothetical protein
VPERNFYSVFAALATTEYMQRNNAKSLKTTAMKKKKEWEQAYQTLSRSHFAFTAEETGICTDAAMI